MSGLQNKLDNVRDSIASLFKRRKGRAKNGGISTPQNVKRVMHITFDSDNQSFNGIPNQWRQYFESGGAEAAVASNLEPGKEETEELLEKERVAEAAVAEFSPHQQFYPTEEPTADDYSTEEYSNAWAASGHYPTEETTAAANSAEEYSNAWAASGHCPTEGKGAADFQTAEQSISDSHVSTAEAEVAAAEASDIQRKSQSRAPRELFSLVYDRDHGQFVNLPPHWEERLRRNNLLQPEFQSNPKLLAMVFSLMDEELRTMRTEGERVESCLYSSLSRRQSSKTTRDLGHPPHYVFRIEADKSNSSSDWDLAATDDAAELTIVTTPAQHHLDNYNRQNGSFVTVKAVEVPDDLDSE